MTIEYIGTVVDAVVVVIGDYSSPSWPIKMYEKLSLVANVFVLVILKAQLTTTQNATVTYIFFIK